MAATMQATLPNLSALPWLAAALCIFFLLYQLLPTLACRFDSRLASARRGGKFIVSAAPPKGLPKPLYTWLAKQLVRAGLRRPLHLQLLLWGFLLPAPLGLLLAIALKRPDQNLFLAGLLASILLNSWLSRRIRQRRRSFQLSLYKIYRFLDLQLTSGIKAMDVLKGLADVIDQPLIRPDFQRFCAQLELTLDIDRALLELDTVFAGPDMNLLASQLRNSLQTGVVGQTFYRMESLMFNRHIALIQARSKQIRTWLVLVALLALIPIEILFLYPIVAQALAAFTQLFGP